MPSILPEAGEGYARRNYTIVASYLAHCISGNQVLNGFIEAIHRFYPESFEINFGQAGLLTCPHLPDAFPSKRQWRKSSGDSGDSQQRELCGILTRFPIKSHRMHSCCLPVPGQK
jgi:hypothetical protein